MKKKQYFLFAALLLGSVVALGVAHQPVFDADIISNTQTSKQAQMVEEPQFNTEPGTLVTDVKCEVANISVQATNAKIELYFSSMNIGEEGEEKYPLYGLTNLVTDEIQNLEDPYANVDYLLPMLEVEVTIKGENPDDKPTVEKRYAPIERTNDSEGFDYDILGSKKFDMLNITTQCIIDNFDPATSSIEAKSFKVLNLYKVHENTKGLYDLTIENGKFQKCYIEAVVTDETTIVQLSDYLDIRFAGRSKFNGVGALQFELNSLISPDPQTHYKNIMASKMDHYKKEIAKVDAEIKEYTDIFDEDTLAGMDEYVQLVINKNSYVSSLEKFTNYLQKIDNGSYDIVTSIKFDASSELIITYKDGTTDSIKLGNATIDLSGGYAKVTFYHKNLIREDIVSVTPTSFKVLQRLFNHSRDRNGKLINSYVDPKDEDFNPTVEFNKIPLAIYAGSTYNYNVDIIIMAVTFGFIAAYELISLITFFILKKKNADDLFKKVRPKQYWTTNTMGLIATTTLLLAVMSSCFRWTVLDNTFEVTNSIDILIVTFAIAAIIFVGYFVRYFAIQIKNIRDKRRNEKLRLNSNSVDDGTILIRSTKEGDK